MKLSEMNGNQLGDMATEVRKSLAAESKREAKGVSWDLHQRECDKNEALEHEIETLKAKVDKLNHSLAGTQLASIKADAIREAMDKIGSIWSSDVGELMIYADKLDEYADKLEAGTL